MTSSSADDLAAVIGALKLGNVDLYGNSYAHLPAERPAALPLFAPPRPSRARDPLQRGPEDPPDGLAR